MSSTVQDTNLFNGISGIFGQNGDGLAPGHSLEVAGNDSVVSITVFNPDRVDLQIEFTRQNENQWLPLGEVTADSRIYYTVWHEGYLYRVRQMSASARGVNVRVQNNLDSTISDEVNGGFMGLVSLNPAGPHTHAISEVIGLEAQLLAIAASIDPNDQSTKTLLLGGQNAPTVNTVPPEIVALTGDDAEPDDTPKAVFDNYIVYYKYDENGSPEETGRISRVSSNVPASFDEREIIAGDGTGATTASGVTLTPLPGENYWPVDLSDYPEGPDENGNPVEFVINIPAVVDQHKIYIKAVNDSATAQRRLVINQTGSLNGTDPATGNSIIIAHGDDSVVLFSRSDGTNFTGYDVVASHIFQNAVPANGNAAATASSDVLYDEVSITAGTTTMTLADMPAGNWWGLHAITTTGAQTRVLPSAWLTPGREFTINRVGDNDITVVVDDGREIDGEALGSILLIPGRADYKVLDDADNTIVLTTPLPHNAGGGSTTTPTTINQMPVALGEVVTAIKNTALRFPLASFDADGIVSAPTITQPANGTVTIVLDNVIEYTPNTDYTGVDEFTFTVDDNDGDTSGAGVISVNVIETQAAYRGSVFPDAQTTSLDKIIIEGHANPLIPNNLYIRYGVSPNSYWMEAGA